MTTKLPALALALIGFTALSVAASSNVGPQQEEWKAPARAAKRKNPISASEKSIAAGKAAYAQQCLSCHGAAGKGDGPAAKDLTTKVLDLASPHALIDTDGAVFWKITEGRTPMPAYEKLLGEDDRWNVVNYLRVLTLAEPRRALSAVLKPYLEAQSALIKNDLVAARAALPGLEEAVRKASSVEPLGLEPRAVSAWKQIQQQLPDVLRNLQAAENLGSYRTAYQDLSDVLKSAIASVGHAESKALMVFKCSPKAPAARTQYWIQAGAPAQNPYLSVGDPPCGEFESRLDPVASAPGKGGG